MKIKYDAVHADAPGQLGDLWRKMAEAENALAEKLLSYPLGSAITNDDSAWHLEADGEALNLVHSSIVEGKAVNQASRFDLDLLWDDVEESGLTMYNEKVFSVAASFDPAKLIDIAALKG